MTLRPSIPLHQHRASRLVTAPAAEPVTAAQLRTHLVVSETEMPDAEANDLIAEARQFIEDQAGIAFVTQTWRLALDRWPGRAEAWWDGVREMPISELYSPDTRASIELPRAPLQSITSVTVYDEANAPTEYTPTDLFSVDTYSMPGRITLRAGATWPIAMRTNNAIEIDYVAGYGDAAAVPATMRRAIRMLAAKMYAERGDGCSVADAYHMSGAKGLVDVYRAVRI
jgi:hypothetical protein